jgi:hypothetical protein
MSEAKDPNKLIEKGERWVEKAIAGTGKHGFRRSIYYAVRYVERLKDAGEPELAKRLLKKIGEANKAYIEQPAANTLSPLFKG